jgi:hypothetical protein
MNVFDSELLIKVLCKFRGTFIALSQKSSKFWITKKNMAPEFQPYTIIPSVSPMFYFSFKKLCVSCVCMCFG